MAERVSSTACLFLPAYNFFNNSLACVKFGNLFSACLNSRVCTLPRAPVVIDRIAQVQHLMKHDVFQRQRRNRGAVENAADNDRIMGWIEVAQQAAGRPAAPAEQWTAQQTVEELHV